MALARYPICIGCTGERWTDAHLILVRGGAWVANLTARLRSVSVLQVAVFWSKAAPGELTDRGALWRLGHAARATSSGSAQIAFSMQVER